MDKNKKGMYIWYGEILSLCLISCNIAKWSFKYYIHFCPWKCTHKSLTVSNVIKRAETGELKDQSLENSTR